MKDIIGEIINEQIENLNKLKDSNYCDLIKIVTEKIVESIKKGGKILIAGNGGSAADAQHFAAEIVGRFLLERKGYPAIALTTDTSILTAVGNDYGYDAVFFRQVEALGNKGDVFIGISTSGNSKNIINAMKIAKQKGLITVGLTGRDGGLLKNICDININFDYNKTARVQEHHLLTCHLISQFVETELKNYYGDN